MCPALRGSTVSHAGVTHLPKHSLEYPLNFWSQWEKKKAKAPCESAYSSPEAMHPCTARKITGRIMSSPDSPMSMPREKKTCRT